MDEIRVEIESSHGGFVLEGVHPASAVGPAIQDNTLLRWWPDTDPDLAGFFVSGGSQWGPFAITARRVPDQPAEPDAQWEDVVEMSIRTAGQVTLSEVVDGYVDSLSVQPGTYRMRLSARGRTEGYERSHAFPDEDEPEEMEALEHFLVEVWPAVVSPARVLRQDSEYARDLLDPPQPVWPDEREPGLRAAWSLVRDVRGEPGARPVPGELGDILLELDLEGTPTQLFNRLRHTHAWPPSRGWMSFGDGVGQTSYHDATLPEFDGAYGSAGHIATTLLDLRKPHRLTMGWNWVPEVDASPEHPFPIDQRPRVLTSDSRVTMTFALNTPPGDVARSTVRLEHLGVPAVWRADLMALWTWHMKVQSER